MPGTVIVVACATSFILISIYIFIRKLHEVDTETDTKTDHDDDGGHYFRGVK